MKVNMPVNDREQPMRDGSILVSKTDLKGIITYCNKDFVRISGYEYGELLGRNHNIVRHPDMPPEAFQDLWDTVNAGRPWTGIVKNRCKNGDYYWVKANVTPLTEHGRTTEFLSVRTKPTHEEVTAAESLYRAINAKKTTLQPHGLKALIKRFNGVRIGALLTTTVVLTVDAFAALAAMIYADVPDIYLYVIIGLLSLLTLVFGLTLTRYVTQPLRYSSRKLQQIAEGNYFDWIDERRNDEFGDLMRSIKSTQIKLGFDVMDAREQADEASRIKTALDCVSTPVTVSGPDNILLYMNSAASDLFDLLGENIRSRDPSFKPERLIGTSLADFFPDEKLREMYSVQLTQTRTTLFSAWEHVLKLVTSPVYDGEGDYRGRVTQWIDVTAEKQVEREIDSIVAAAREGVLDRRIGTDGKEGFFLEVSSGINAFIGVVDQAFRDVEQVMSAMAEGDLTRPITSAYQGTFDQVKNNVNRTITQLERTVTDLRDTADVIATASNEIFAGNNNLSNRTEQQASALEETASSMEELTSTVRNNADNAQQANQLASSARMTAEKGGEVVSRAIEAMKAINQSSSKIAEIIGVIDEIAFQTNLLALNASVEAARAGDQGRGFAVVATEVRNLAGRSATAAKEIKELIQDSVQKVEAGASLVDQSGTTLGEIVTSVKKVGDIVSEIAAASAEQSAGIDQVNQAVTSMDAVTQQNAALAEQTSAASASLNEKAREMDQLMSFFKLSQRNNPSLSRQAVSAVRMEKPTAPSSAPGRSSATMQERGSVRVAPVRPEPVDDGDEWEEF